MFRPCFVLWRPLSPLCFAPLAGLLPALKNFFREFPLTFHQVEGVQWSNRRPDADKFNEIFIFSFGQYKFFPVNYGLTEKQSYDPLLPE